MVRFMPTVYAAVTFPLGTSEGRAIETLRNGERTQRTCFLEPPWLVTFLGARERAQAGLSPLPVLIAKQFPQQ